MAKIYGDGGDNALSGGAENDMMYGYAGADQLSGGDGNDVLYGGAGDDTLLGGEGDDQLTGGEGEDVLIGGNGNDTYYIDDRQDVVVEAAGGGVDTVVFLGYANDGGSQGYTLRPNVENLRLQSGSTGLNLNGTGNELNNSIQGDGGHNNIFGAGGNDNLYGYGGNDTIRGGTGNDVMNGGDGVDLASYKDAANGVTVSLAVMAAQNTGDGLDKLAAFENLEGSQFGDALTGDSGANKILGLAGADTLRGGAGNDDLTGGAGDDVYRFEGTATNGVDAVRGFVSGSDTAAFFTADGYAANATVTFGSSATGTGPQFVYNSATHELSYDSNGSAAGGSTLLARFLGGDLGGAGDVTLDGVSLAPPPAGGNRVGYYEVDTGDGESYQVDPIVAAVGEAVDMHDLSAAELSGLDVLFVTNSDNFGYGAELVAQSGAISDWVDAGGTLIFFDRHVDTAETVLPGAGGADIRGYSYGADIDFVNDASAFATGPGGSLDDTSLDGGNYSWHGFTVAGALPAGGIGVHTTGDAGEFATIAYGFGAGKVVYSTIPADHYLQNYGDPSMNNGVAALAGNIIDWAIAGGDLSLV